MTSSATGRNHFFPSDMRTSFNRRDLCLHRRRCDTHWGSVYRAIMQRPEKFGGAPEVAGVHPGATLGRLASWQQKKPRMYIRGSGGRFAFMPVYLFTVHA